MDLDPAQRGLPGPLDRDLSAVRSLRSGGAALRVTSDFLYPIVVCVSSMTTFLTPYLMKWSDPLAEAVSRTAPRGITAAVERCLRYVGRLGRVRGKVEEKDRGGD